MAQQSDRKVSINTTAYQIGKAMEKVSTLLEELDEKENRFNGNFHQFILYADWSGHIKDGDDGICIYEWNTLSEFLEEFSDV